MNFTILALRMARMSVIPMLSGSSMITAVGWHVQRFAAPVFWNANVKSIQSSSFTHGLSSAVHISRAGSQDTPYNEQFSKAVVVDDVLFYDILVTDADSPAVVKVTATGYKLSASNLRFSKCSGPESVCELSAGSGEISSLCMTECESGAAGYGLSMTTTGSLNVDLVSVIKSVSGAGPIMVNSGTSAMVTNVNMSGGACEISGLMVRLGQTASSTLDVSYARVGNNEGKGVMVLTDDAGLGKSAWEYMEVRENNITEWGVLKLQKEATVVSSYFMDNTFNKVDDEYIYFVGESTDNVALSGCTMSFGRPSGLQGITFTECSFNKVYVDVKTFYGVNTELCPAEAEPLGLGNFFDTFTTEETVGGILIAIAIVWVIMHTAYHTCLPKCGKHGSSDSDESY